MPPTTTEDATVKVQIRKLDYFKRMISDLGLDGEKVVREILIAYEQEHLKDFPFMSDLSSKTEPAPAGGDGGGKANHFETIPGGAVRSPKSAGARAGRPPARFDLAMMNTVAMRRWAEAFGEGQLKGYGPNNWMKGIPESNIVEHLTAHINEYLAGDRSEDHLAHAFWNLGTWMWMEERRPDLMDLTGETNKKIDK